MIFLLYNNNFNIVLSNGVFIDVFMLYLLLLRIKERWFSGEILWDLLKKVGIYCVWYLWVW